MNKAIESERMKEGEFATFIRNYFQRLFWPVVILVAFLLLDTIATHMIPNFESIISFKDLLWDFWVCIYYLLWCAYQMIRIFAGITALGACIYFVKKSLGK